MNSLYRYAQVLLQAIIWAGQAQAEVFLHIFNYYGVMFPLHGFRGTELGLSGLPLYWRQAPLCEPSLLLGDTFWRLGLTT